MGWRDDPITQTASTDPSTPAWAKDAIVNAPASINFGQPMAKVRADIAQLPPEQRKAANKAWAATWVKKERKDGDTGQFLSDRVRNMTRGTVVGSWLDEANAITSSGLHKISGGIAGAPYDEAMAYQAATDEALDKEAAKAFRVPGTEYDVTTADLEKVAGGVLSAPVTPVVQAVRGVTMIPRMVNAAITGLGYGALYGAGQGEGLEDRALEATKGAGVGVVLGPIAEPVSRGASHVIGAGRDLFRGRPAPLQQYERGAVNALTRSTTDDGLAARYQQQAADLGPEGMLADMGSNMRGQASALANQPGEGQQMIRDALHTRRQDAAGRISADVDQALRPAVNMPETLEATRRAYAQQARPHRDQFQNNPVPFTQQLDDTLQTLAQHEPAVIREAARYAALDPAAGPRQFFARQLPDGTYEITRVPNATEWDYLKRALDGLSNPRTASANDQRVYGHWARRLRTDVDEALSPGAPQNSPWAQARRLEAEDFQMREAADQGRTVFDRQLSPDQLRAELFGVGQPPRGGMNPPQAAAHMLGARDQVRSIMGNASTAHGENAAAAARSKLGSDYAREKIDILAGPQAAGDLTRRLDAETVFDQTRQAVTQNSATAGRLQAQREFPNAADRTETARELGKRGVYGHAVEGAYRIGNFLLGGALDERRMRIARDAAEMLIQQGHSRDQVANALFMFAAQRNHSAAQRQSISRFIGTIMRGGQQRAIEASDGDAFPQFVFDAVNRRNEGDRRKVTAE